MHVTTPSKRTSALRHRKIGASVPTERDIPELAKASEEGRFFKAADQPPLPNGLTVSLKYLGSVYSQK